MTKFAANLEMRLQVADFQLIRLIY